MRRMKGKVVDDADPKFQGRVRIRVASLHREAADDEIPWAQTHSQSEGDVAINTPPKGRWVYVDVTDPHEPVYLGNVLHTDSVPDFLKQNYPARKGLHSTGNFQVYRDESDGSFAFIAPDGTMITGDGHGHLVVKAPDNGSITTTVGDASMVMTNAGTVFSKPVTFNDVVTFKADAVGEADVTASGISLKNHTHSGVQSGGSSTGKPQ